MTFEELHQRSKEKKERGDCTVKAVAVVCGVIYDVAHKAMAEAGRPLRGRSDWEMPHNAIRSLGFELVEENFPGKTLVTLERDLQRYARGRKFYIEVRGHVVGFNGEQVVDWTKGRRHRVIKVYRVKPVEGTVTGRMVVKKSSAEEVDRPEPWLADQPRPRGAPKKGARIKLRLPENQEIELTVTDFMAAQFVAESDAGRARIVHIGDDWVMVQ